VALAAALDAAAAEGPLPDAAETFGFRRGAFLARGHAARPVGMGEAFTAVADDASAVTWNPGGLGQVERLQGVVQYDAAGSGMGLAYVAVAAPVGAPVAGVSAAWMNYGTWERRGPDGRLLGVETAQDWWISAAVASPNPPGVGGHTGVAVEWVREAVGGALVGASAGSVVPLSPQLQVAWTVQHFGTRAEGFSLPQAVRLGVRWRAGGGLALAADLGYGLTDKQPIAAAGAEFFPVRALALRAGYRHAPGRGLGAPSGLTAGAGLRAGRVGVDYAIQPFAEFGNSHRLALVAGLGRSAAAEREARAEALRPVAISTLGGRPRTAFVPSADPVREAEEAFRAAVAAYHAGDTALAAARSGEAVRLNPLYWEAWQLRGAALAAAGDRAGALAAMRKSLELHPDNPSLQAYVKRLEGPEGGVEMARAAYRAGMRLYADGDLTGAAKKAAEAVAADGRNWQAWQLLGTCQYEQGDRDGARASWRRALEINPEAPGLRDWLDRLER
jgi:Tfp pilus assembly protein PilF